MIIGIIQVRMGSTRLPGKILKEVMGKPMLAFQLERLKHSKLLDKVIIATTTNDKDNAIVEFAKEQGVICYTGSEMDIVDRLYQAAKKNSATAIVRITGDCPFVDPALIDQFIQYHREHPEVDYISNVHPASFPDGLDLDLVKMSALERLWQSTRGDSFNSEWFYHYLKENPDQFKRVNISCKTDLSHLRLTVDYKEDLDLINKIAQRLGTMFELKDVVELLQNDDEIKQLHDRSISQTKFERDIAYKEALSVNAEKKTKTIATAKGKQELHHPFMVGERIYLRGFEKKDLCGNFFQWANDPQVTHFLFMGTYPNHIELLEEQYEKSIRDNSEVQFIIADKKTNEAIGFCGLHRIEWIGRSCEYRIFIGEKDFWGKGIGSEAGILLIRYAFDKLNMNKVWLGINSDHVAGVKSYKKLGFVEEGVLREEIYRNGRYYGATRMSILRSEFYAKTKDVHNDSALQEKK